MTRALQAIPSEFQRLNEGQSHDPFSILGQHQENGALVLRTLLPFAEQAFVYGSNEPLHRVPGTDIFECTYFKQPPPRHYQIFWIDAQGHEHVQYDPWSFLAQLTDFDLHLFCEGRHQNAYQFLGSHVLEIDGISGVLFAVWAPNAERISVVGQFNQWNGRCHPMRSRGSSGVWELFIPGIGPGDFYKYEIRQRHTGHLLIKSDPYARQYELRPGNASRIAAPSQFQWQDQTWLEHRANQPWLNRPMSIYEVHLGSWRKTETGHFKSYRELAHELVDYAQGLGFTHIELLPITEYPFDGSWGYQATGFFAPTSRFGEAEDFKYFVDYCHQHSLGVLLDWVPGHFPRDDHALANFDGTPLYEHADPRRGEHKDWGTLIFNYGRHEVKCFLISSAIFWLKEYHIDGLRVDAVASMLYLDYSREDGEWEPNIYGGNENLEAIDFMRELNQITHTECPGSLMIAEESTAWPQVTRPTWLGGLGFSMKWNMGWMHDTLRYMSHDPIHRHYHHDDLTFGLLYAFTENFVLPFSHDEVVHGKGPMIYKMPGDEWQRFANLRALYTFMYTYPGKKLLFMGSEFGQTSEWNHDKSLDWWLLDHGVHQGVQKLIKDLNHLYQNEPALHHYDFDSAGFEWIDCHDAAQSVLVYLRRFEEQVIIVALNFTPVPRTGYRIGVPQLGRYEEVHNSDSGYYEGSNIGNPKQIEAEAIAWMNRPASVQLSLPPLAGVVLKYIG